MMSKKYEILDTVQGSGEWLDMRLAVLTGSKAEKAVGTKAAQESLIAQLISEELAGAEEELFKSYAMEWGIMNEPLAIEQYELRSGEKCEEIGFIKSTEYPWMGISPDRLIKREYGWHGVEVKCPNTATMVGYMMEGGIPKKYLPQVLHYFIVIDDMDVLDFVVYDPRIQKTSHQMFRVRVTREELREAIELQKEKYHSFRAKWEEAQLQVFTLKQA